MGSDVVGHGPFAVVAPSGAARAAVGLGEPKDGGRVGSLPAGGSGMRGADEVVEDMRLALERRSGALAGRAGTAAYAPEVRGLA